MCHYTVYGDRRQNAVSAFTLSSVWNYFVSVSRGTCLITLVADYFFDAVKKV